MKPALQIPILLCALACTVQGAGTIYSTLLRGGGQDYAASVASDAQGNTYVAGLTYSPDFPVTPGAFQTTFGQTCDAFVAKLGPDGKVLWATYLGGILDDYATGVAVDGAGNVLVTGYTRSANFPLANPIQSTQSGFAAFVAKLDPSGARLLYSTFLSGQGQAGAAGIAVDSAGNAYVAVNAVGAAGFPGAQNAPNQSGIVVSKLTPRGTLAYSFFHPYGLASAIALDAAGAAYIAGSSSSTDPSTATQAFGTPGSVYATVFKISPDGSRKVYETALGGSVQEAASSIAVTSTGEVYVAGSTASADFPVVHPLQSSLGARPLWKSTNSGTTWTPIDNLPYAIPQMLAVDPTAPNTLYAASGDLGVMKSADAGATWTKANRGIPSTNLQALAIDPIHPQTLYAATAAAFGSATSAVYKSVDGAAIWSAVDTAAFHIIQLNVDAQNPNNIYEVGADTSYVSGSNIRKSTDGGATWAPVTIPGTPAGTTPETPQSLVLDPHASGVILVVSNQETSGPHGVGVNRPTFLWRSVDGGATWTLNQSVTPTGLPGLVIDGSTNPSTVYDGLAFRSVDGGITWSPLPASPASSNTSTLAVDPNGTLYAANAGGIFISRDRGQSWTATGAPVYPNIASIVPAGSAGAVYATIKHQTGSTAVSLGINQGFTFDSWTSAFVTKLSADGSALEYSTYLGGHPAAETSSIYSSEPLAFQTQGWISGIAIDSAGNLAVAGGTRATDLATANPLQSANAGLADAFAATISADGSKLTYSTYYGGSQDDGALAAALDSQGNLILAGQTWSGDFPVPGGSQAPFSFGDGFVVKLSLPGPPAITSVLNAASYQPGIEAGSWVMIRGANLSNTNPGRVWTPAEVVNGKLPTSLDGVSVTIDGKPAFVYYISPTQINVQAPSDSALGAVNVVVNNNGAVSPPATAQLQAVAPAFFVYGATNYAVASRLPDFALVGDPSVEPGAVAVRPGDTLVLWGTGFGATNPAVAAGTTISGAPAVATTPDVTVGGVAAPVIGAVLTTGSAGLYQVTIQMPSNVPTGVVAVRASVGGAQTPSGVTIFVAAP